MRLSDDVMACETVRRELDEDMLSQMHANPRRAAALKALRALMDTEFDYIVEHVVEPFRVFRVRSYTRRRILKERQRVNWVNPAFTRSKFFPSYAGHGPRRPPESKEIERMYYLWRWGTPEGRAVSPVLPEEALD